MVLSVFEQRIQEFIDSAAPGSFTIDVPAIALLGAVRSIVARYLRTHREDELISLCDDGIKWVRSYAIPARRERWSTGPDARLPAAPEPPLPPVRRAPRRLPRGRHGLPAGVIARSQRTRIIYGTAEVMMNKGYENATVADIVAAAGVSRDVFYEHFTDKHNAFLEAQQHPTQHILDTCAAAYFSAQDWPERIWRTFAALLEMVVANTAISHLRLVECYAAGPDAIRRAEEITRSFTIFLEEGYGYRPQARELPHLSSQAIAGGDLRDHPAPRRPRRRGGPRTAPSRAHLHRHRAVRGARAGGGADLAAQGCSCGRNERSSSSIASLRGDSAHRYRNRRNFR